MIKLSMFFILHLNVFFFLFLYTFATYVQIIAFTNVNKQMLIHVQKI